MFNKIGKFIRKAHRFITPIFIVVTILFMLVFQVPVLERIQKILMLTMAVSGAYMYVQIYVNRYKSNKRKALKAKG